MFRDEEITCKVGGSIWPASEEADPAFKSSADADSSKHTHKKIQLWGGLECTVNRVQNEYFSQLDWNGHTSRSDDLDRFASLGISAIRYPVLWERTAPNGIDSAEWCWSDERLHQLLKLDIEVIIGLLHHGSGPSFTSLIDPGFPEKLAQFAGAVAARYPWVAYYTPVNEPLTTARFSGLYGVWYPHGKDDKTFVTALINQCRGVVLSMKAIRAINPQAKLVQTDDLGKTYSTPSLAWLADFYNERRWLAWDLLCGMVDEHHALWNFLVGTGVSEQELLWFKANPCPPDIIGVNYYTTSERWIDEATSCYPEQYAGYYRGLHHVDIEASRVVDPPSPGVAPLLKETWERYHIPIAVTEVHIDASREDQLRWLMEIWDAAQEASSLGAEIVAVTVWSLLGSYDWNCLVTACNGYYEPGPFDVRSSRPRPTALAEMMRELAAGRTPISPVLHGQGWWRRPSRFLCLSGVQEKGAIELPSHESAPEQGAQPILIAGASGTLGNAFARICEARHIAYRVTSRDEMDIANPSAVDEAILRFRPWAIVNAAGYVQVDEAELNHQQCFRENTTGPVVLANACVKHHIQLLIFSTDLVFDGCQTFPYKENDTARPLNIYGQSKLTAERHVLEINPAALIIRTSAFFGPWDKHNFLNHALNAMAAGQSFWAATDIVSPTYVPDLTHTCLDLLIDGEAGIWHLTNNEPISWTAFAARAGELAGVNTQSLLLMPNSGVTRRARRPAYAALSSSRAILLPSLEDALNRYLHSRKQTFEADLAEKNIHYGRT